MFTVGRRANNDLSVSDISVSRRQAFLEFVDQKVYLQDIDSKFGTFKQVRGIMPIDTDQVVPIQIEKKCFFFQRQNRFSSISRMC